MDNYISWKIHQNNGQPIVKFYLEKDGETKLVHTEELENVIGDYVEQREDNWIE